jgi:hypothetical protein
MFRGLPRWFTGEIRNETDLKGPDYQRGRFMQGDSPADDYDGDEEQLEAAITAARAQLRDVKDRKKMFLKQK